MMLSNKYYNRIAILLVITMLISCSTDLDDINRYNIEGKWKLEGIFKFDLEGNLLDINDTNMVWDVDKDSIEYTNSYYFGEDIGTGVLSSKVSHKTFPDGFLNFGPTLYTIDVLTQNDLIFSVKRPDYYWEWRLYSID